MMEQLPATPLLERIRVTFLAPRELWDRLKGAAPWIDVLLIATAVAMLAVLAVPAEVFLDPMREAVSRRGEPVEITSPPDEIVLWGRAMGMLATLATHPMIAVTVAGFLTLVFSILGGGRGTFRDYISLTSHTLLIPALGTLLALAIRLLTGSSVADPLDLLPLGGGEGLIATAALALDPFIIWMLVVLGISTAQVDGKRRPWRTTLVLLGAYVILLLLTSALAIRSAA